MIRLDVEEYCQDCPAFEPVSESTVVYGDNRECARDTRVACKNEKMCRNYVSYLRKQLTK